MDPLSILSIAGTVVQFVDFGSKLLKEGRGLYKSSGGISETNMELQIITTALRSVITKLRQSPKPSEISRPLTNTEHEVELSFNQICDGVASVAEELCAKLETLKVQNHKHPKWDSVMKAVRNVWSKQEVVDIVGRLLTFKEALNTHLLSAL